MAYTNGYDTSQDSQDQVPGKSSQDVVRGYYTDILGRPGSDDEVNSHITNLNSIFGSTSPQALAYLMNQFYQSDEYKNKQAAPGEVTQNYESSGGGGGGGGTSGASKKAPSYTPPAFTPSPFVMPDGKIPPGLPYSPNMPMRGLQDNVLQNILTTPALSQDFINRQNEAGKEMALQRSSAAKQGLLQNAAGRGTLPGGTLQSREQRLEADTLAELLKSQRDIASQAEIANREGQINALGASEGILGGREDRGLNVARFGELIRQYDLDLANRQSEFGANLDYNYNNLNAQLEQAFIRALFGLG